MSKVYDIFTVSGQKLVTSSGARLDTVRAIGWNEMERFCRYLEKSSGPLYVKHSGGLDKFINGHLKVGSYEAVKS